jgi:hypothetical protein
LVAPRRGGLGAGEAADVSVAVVDVAAGEAGSGWSMFALSALEDVIDP